MSAANYHIGTISPEQFIAEHTFAFIIKGVMHLYDGNKNYRNNRSWGAYSLIMAFHKK